MGRKVLIAIELDDASAKFVIGKALSIARDDDELHVVHVIEPTTMAYNADPSLLGVAYESTYKDAMDKAHARLEELCEGVSRIGADQCHVRYGRIAREVHQFVTDEGFDALMIGSHGYSGWQLLLGSKASSILHGAPVSTWVFKLEKD